MAYKGSGKKAKIQSAGGSRSGYSLTNAIANLGAPKSKKIGSAKQHHDSLKGGGGNGGGKRR